MIEALRITNYAIIDQLEVEFASGLTTITGETGAGKSVLLGALKLLLGDRAATESLRSGAERASIEAIFRVTEPDVRSWLEDGGFTDGPDEEQLILRRELLASGSSRSFINGRSATLGQLRDLGPRLVDLHAQHEHTNLFSPGHQLRLLDGYGNYDRELDEYRKAYSAWRDATARLSELSTDTTEAERRRAFLAFQIEEITKADLMPGEDETLEAERRRLQNAERLGVACQSAIDYLYDGERTELPAAALLTTVAKALADVAQLDPSQEQFMKDAEALHFSVVDLAERIRDYAADVADDPGRLAESDERLQVIRSLKKKYGATIPEILACCEGLTRELTAIENHDAELAKARDACAKATATVLNAARLLSVQRAKAARGFEKSVEREMQELELPKAVFQIRLTSPLDAPADDNSATDDLTGSNGSASAQKTPSGPDDTTAPRAVELEAFQALPPLSPSGADVIEFMVSLNPGEEARPLRKVASGGEIARIMLAIKAVLAEGDDVPTFIFDEIDVGISGQAAARVGDKLCTLADHHQVFCITHLPQVAARGATHLFVEKSVHEGRTRTAVRALESDERADALARMLSGEAIDETSRLYAQKLLERR